MSRENNERRRPEAIGDIVGQIMSGREENVPEKIMRLWPEIFDGPAEKHTAPVRLENGVLTVNVNNSAWLYQLTLEKRNIRNRINELCPEAELKQIVFKSGSGSEKI